MSSDSAPIDDLRAALRRSVRKITALEAELARAARRESEPIAIVGVGCRMPGNVQTADEFWELLSEGRDGISELPEDRPQLHAVAARHPALRRGGFVAGVDRFDAQFFGISPREAEWIDPQQRLLLEVSWQALEHAGQIVEQLAGTRTGVFFGMVSSEGYLEATREASRAAAEAYAATGSTLSVAAGRVAYTLGLHGPALVVDTACSSALLAVHLACRSLRDGESDSALAGGVSLMLSGHDAHVLTAGDALAVDGRCRAFDAAAAGLVRAEGCGVVVLKRLSDAQAAGDRVLATILGSAVNQDGRSAGLTAPNVHAQEDVLRRALANARLEPAAIDFIEAHGTGTALGDPIELEALKRVFGEAAAPGAPRCLLGAVKTNLGHTEGAAGIAGLIKTVLALHNETIPQNLHFSALNPRVSLDGTRLEVASQKRAWPRSERPRRAGVSSFGLSGTNVHMVVEEAPPSAMTPRAGSVSAAVGGDDSARRQVLWLSARDEHVLREQAGRYADFIAASDSGLGDICYSAARRRSWHHQRLAVIGQTRAELCEGLRAFEKAELRPGVVAGQELGYARPKLVFVFPGQGSQWLGMGRQLYASEPVFRSTVDACAQAAAAHCAWSLRDVLLCATEPAYFEQVRTLQPLLVTVEIALAALMRSRGIVPDAVVGASMGEIAAACAAGALSVEQAMAIVCKRSAVLSEGEELAGRMALTELSFEEAERWIADYAGRIAIASSNSPCSTVLSGDSDALQELFAKLEQKKLFCRWVKAKGAGHSHHVEPLLPAIARALGEIVPQASRVPVYSSLEGRQVDARAFDTDYWLRNARQTVRFSQACTQLIEAGHALFLELSPHPILLPSIQQVAAKLDRPCVALGSLYRKRDDDAALLEALAGLHCHGFPVDWSEYYAEGRLVTLPAYPFRRDRHWISRSSSSAEQASSAYAEPGPSMRHAPLLTSDAHPLLGRGFRMAYPSSVRYWDRALDLNALAYLADHRIERVAVLPAAAVIEMASAAAREVLGTQPLVLEDVELKEALVLDESQPVRVQITLEDLGDGVHAFRLARQLDDASPEAFRLHATCTVRRASAAESTTSETLAGADDACDTLREPVAIYAALAALGGNYGPAFRGLVTAHAGPALARVEAELPALISERGYTLHPALLDACMQSLAVAELPAGLRPEQACVPVSIERVIVRAPLPRRVSAVARVDAARSDAANLCAELAVYSPETPLALVSLHGISVRPVQSPAEASALDELILASSWQPAPRCPALPAKPGRWLIVADAQAVSSTLREQLERAGAEVDCLQLSADVATEAELIERISAAVTQAQHGAVRLSGIVHLAGLDALPVPVVRQQHAADGGDSWISAIGRQSWLVGLHLARAVSSLPRQRDAARLCFVTCNAQAVIDEPRIAPEQALLWGLAGSVRAETSAWQVRRIDIDCAQTALCDLALARELFADDEEDQVALRGEQRYVARLGPAVDSLVRPEFAARADATYLITGGMSGLGLSAAQWLAARGAGHLLLVGRHIPTDEPTEQRFAELERLGSRVSLVPCDVSDAQALAAVLAPYASGELPLRGVIHSAGALQDGLLARQTESSCKAVFTPKLGGAWLLHELTQHLPLDLFVVYSSAASLLGSAAQANYAAANAFVDALIHARRREGLPGLSINWGQFAEVGHVADKEFRGMRGLREREGHQVLDRLLRCDVAQRAAVALNLAELLDVYPQMARWPYVRDMASSVARHDASGDPELLALLRSGDAAHRRQCMRDYLRREFGRVLRIDPARIDEHAPLSRLGLDSLMGLELRRRLEAALGVALEATLVWTYPTVAALGEYLSDLIAPAVEPIAPLTAAEDRAESLAALSDDQLWNLTNALLN